MHDKNGEWLLFELGDDSKPDDANKTGKAAVTKPRRIGKAKSIPPESLQPYLPGFSRRGRPRSKNPVPATVRASESRKRRLGAGMKRIELLLAPEIAADLERLRRYYRVSRVEIISRLVAKAAKRIPGE
ncbi:MAG: hypothetical protein ACK4Q4_03070 [Rhodocyclaceae bacterium]